MIYLIIKTWIRNYDYTSIKNQIIWKNVKES
jgi:hypothetical protein